MNREKKYEFRLLLAALFRLTLEQNPPAIKKQIKGIESWIEQYVTEEVENSMKTFINNN